MAGLVPVEALTREMFPDWLRDATRMASVRVAEPDWARFRIDPGPAFERYAVLARQPGYAGRVFNLTIYQRCQPYQDLQFVVSSDLHQDRIGEAVWRGLNHANLLAPAEYWRTGGAGYTIRKPLWTVEADARQPGAARVLEALAEARAAETGLPHYVSRRGHRACCSVNAPHRGEFYSVNAEGEWSLHYQPATYPLDGPPGRQPDRSGIHPVMLAHLRYQAEPSTARTNAAGALPVIESPGRAPLPKAAWPPEAFTVPFRAKGDNLIPPAPEPHELLIVTAKKEKIAMPKTAREPASIASAPAADSPPTDDPWEGANAEVRLVPDAARFAKAAGLAQAGFVIEVKQQADDASDRVCTVHFPGRTGNVDLPNDLLTAAPPFPAVTTSHGEIASIETAEALLIDSAARVRYQLEWNGPPDPAANEDRGKLAKALGNACGIDPHDLVRQLDPMIDQQVSAYQAARAAHPAGRKRTGKRASAVAAADVPKPRKPAAKTAAADSQASSKSTTTTRSKARARAGR